MIRRPFCARISMLARSSGHPNWSNSTDQNCSIETTVCCAECMVTDSLSHSIKLWPSRFVSRNTPSLSVQFCSVLLAASKTTNIHDLCTRPFLTLSSRIAASSHYVTLTIVNRGGCLDMIRQCRDMVIKNLNVREHVRCDPCRST